MQIYKRLMHLFIYDYLFEVETPDTIYPGSVFLPQAYRPDE